jgi:hypothetical protein
VVPAYAVSAQGCVSHRMRMNANQDGLLGIPVAIGFTDFHLHLSN